VEQNADNRLDRRGYLQRAALVAGATAWATPTVQSLMSPAFATGTGVCPPGRMIRFKYDVENGVFDSGGATGGGASWCLPDGYADADISVNSVGCFTLDGMTKCISVVVAPDQMSATVTVPPGCLIEDLQAKAGNTSNGECDDAEANTGTTATVTLEEKEISFVAGVLCC
jgi:hypothetical protein